MQLSTRPLPMMIKRVTQKVCLRYGREGCQDDSPEDHVPRVRATSPLNGNDIHVVSVTTILEIEFKSIGGLVQHSDWKPQWWAALFITLLEGSQAIPFQDTSLLLANGHVHYHQEGKLAAQMPLSLMETCKASVTIVLSITKGIYSW